jgi:hypothetical protein
VIGLIDDLDDVALFGGVEFVGELGGVFHGANVGARTLVQGKLMVQGLALLLSPGEIFCSIRSSSPCIH